MGFAIEFIDSHHSCLTIWVSLSADYFHKCWESSCSGTEASDFSSPGLTLLFGLNCWVVNLNYMYATRLDQVNVLLQVVALCQAPFLLDDPNVGLLFPADAISRAKHYLSVTSGGLGIHFTCLSCYVIMWKGVDISKCTEDFLV